MLLPQLLLFYLELLILITYMDRSGLYCSSKSLLESLNKVTPYCIITGMKLSDAFFFFLAI